MNLTGKCKEDFIKWYHLKRHEEDYCFMEDVTYLELCHFPLAMQYGVLVDFFDSVGYHISNISSPEDVAQGVAEGNIDFFCILTRIGKIDFETGFYKYRKESLIKIVEQSNYFYNNS
ncbi:hypothetical protein [Tenacibaculum finnmarkense]|uniref:hypothetical protein n=1 Tax=Tenacibaculum finnmarkense TaxID=2781243 RepID=UPI00187B19B2|nr:hypothetical protein [Tenacibaculum finnmarkense]MBE7646249.1 hypothetical protein [Tenacibaculum finnmarkense genomovar ulcerans]MCD8410376.1 hypothetical protein [Tenacibaculum finnmarkense genomovar ulcerans]